MSNTHKAGVVVGVLTFIPLKVRIPFFVFVFFKQKIKSFGHREKWNSRDLRGSFSICRVFG